jgi:hypothetical protein
MKKKLSITLKAKADSKTPANDKSKRGATPDPKKAKAPFKGAKPMPKMQEGGKTPTNKEIRNVKRATKRVAKRGVDGVNWDRLAKKSDSPEYQEALAILKNYNQVQTSDAQRYESEDGSEMADDAMRSNPRVRKDARNAANAIRGSINEAEFEEGDGYSNSRSYNKGDLGRMTLGEQAYVGMGLDPADYRAAKSFGGMNPIERKDLPTQAVDAPESEYGGDSDERMSRYLSGRRTGGLNVPTRDELNTEEYQAKGDSQRMSASNSRMLNETSAQAEYAARKAQQEEDMRLMSNLSPAEKQMYGSAEEYRRAQSGGDGIEYNRDEIEITAPRDVDGMDERSKGLAGYTYGRGSNIDKEDYYGDGMYEDRRLTGIPEVDKSIKYLSNNRNPEAEIYYMLARATGRDSAQTDVTYEDYLKVYNRDNVNKKVAPMSFDRFEKLKDEALDRSGIDRVIDRTEYYGKPITAVKGIRIFRDGGTIPDAKVSKWYNDLPDIKRPVGKFKLNGITYTT